MTTSSSLVMYTVVYQSEQQENFFKLHSQFPGIMFSRLKFFYNELGSNFDDAKEFLLSRTR
jgi:hypothetical protein